MKNNQLITVCFIAAMIIGQLAFITLPSVKGSALASFGINPPSYAFQAPGSKDFVVTATLPGGSGSNGVNVYLTPDAGQIAPGIAITYDSNPLYIMPNQRSGNATMTITVDSNAINGSIPITIGAFDNPGSGGTIQIGSFSITLHINQFYLNITSPYGNPFPAGNWYNEGTEVTVGVTTTLAEESGTQYNFNGWFSNDIGGYTGADVSHTVTMTNNISETAIWATNLYLVNFKQTGSDIPAIISYEYTAGGITYDGTATVSFNVWVDQGSTITFSYPDLLAQPGIQCPLISTNTTSPLTVTNRLTILGSYKTQYEVNFASSPAVAGSTYPTGNIWVDLGTTIAISATPAASYHFDYWSSDTSSIILTDSIASVNGPGTITANFAYNEPVQLKIQVGTIQTAGEPFSVLVTAVDNDENRIGAYTGTVTFSSSDHAAGVNLPAEYTFTLTDEGSHRFDGVTLVTGGSQTITATDGSLSGYTTITVIGNMAMPNAIKIIPDIGNVEAGKTIAFSAEMFDAYGNSLGDITNDISASNGWKISAGAGGKWDGAIYTAETASAASSPWTVTGTYNEITGTANLTVTHSTNPNELVSVTLSPMAASIKAGETQDYTATALDSYGNTWDVTDKISSTKDWSITNGAGGYWTENVYSAEKATSAASPWIVTGIYEGVSGTASLTVTHSDNVRDIDHIIVSLNPSIVAAPNTVTGTATAYDSFGNSWDISTIATWSITDGNDGGSWTENIYTSRLAGTYSVQVVYQGLTASTPLVVTHATNQAYLDYIVITPKTASIYAGTSQTYTATAYDTFGNDWIVDAVLSCANSGLTISDRTVSANIAGIYTITGTYSGKTDTASLTVTPNPAMLDRIVISPTASIIATGSSQSYYVMAFDQFNNSLGDVTSASTFSANGAPITGNTITRNSAGIYTVTADYNGKNATATLTVYASSSNSLTSTTTTTASPSVIRYSITFTQNGLSEGQSWNITFNEIIRFSNTSKIVFSNIAYGIYTWATSGKISGEIGTQYIPSTTNGTISVPSESNISINYTTQYYLTINSTYSNPTGAGWYNANSTANIGIDTQATDSSGNQYAFNGWIGTGNGSYTGPDNPGTVIMTSPITEIAAWEQQTSLYSVLLIALLILATIILALLVVWRRRKRKSKRETANQAPT